jgi:hypothetical protein
VTPNTVGQNGQSFFFEPLWTIENERKGDLLSCRNTSRLTLSFDLIGAIVLVAGARNS